MVALTSIAIKGVHWAKDGRKFAYSVDGCDASYMTKYNLVRYFAGASQCYYGAEQARMAIYLRARPNGSRSRNNESAGLEQLFGPISL